jgi:hypothetical protein
VPLWDGQPWSPWPRGDVDESEGGVLSCVGPRAPAKDDELVEVVEKEGRVASIEEEGEEWWCDVLGSEGEIGEDAAGPAAGLCCWWNMLFVCAGKSEMRPGAGARCSLPG